MVTYIKDRNPSMDSWRIKDFKLVGSYTEFTPLEQIKKKLEKHPNYWQILQVPKVSDRLYARYLNIREKNVYDEEAVYESISKEDIQRGCLILALKDIMTHDPSLSPSRLTKYIKDEYDIPISRPNVDSIFKDAKMLVSKIREQAVKESLGEGKRKPGRPKSGARS